MKGDESLDRTLAEALRARPAAGCPGETALLAFYGGRLAKAESESIREHLARCAPCVELARDAREFRGAMEAAPQSPRRVGYWLAAAAALATATLAGLVVARSRPAATAPRPEPETAASAPAPAKSWKDLAIAPAPYAPVAPEDELAYRSGEPAPGGAFAEAMSHYVRGDYAAADAALARFLEAHPGQGAASYYRGVCLLLLGKPGEAVPLLRSAAASSKSPDEPRWYLALALLKAGDGDAALPGLDAIAGTPGPRAAEAAALAREVRRGVGGR